MIETTKTDIDEIINGYMDTVLQAQSTHSKDGNEPQVLTNGDTINKEKEHTNRILTNDTTNTTLEKNKESTHNEETNNDPQQKTADDSKEGATLSPLEHKEVADVGNPKGFSAGGV